MPERAHLGDAGYDLRSVERVDLAPGARALVRTGISVAIPEGYAGLVLPRSGLAVRYGISLVNTPGLIDSGYRGEIQVPLINHDREETFLIEEGTRIAQLVLRTCHLSILRRGRVPRIGSRRTWGERLWLLRVLA